ncbi:MAG: hypothetical protein ACOCRK_05580, partial [bacterium]
NLTDSVLGEIWDQSEINYFNLSENVTNREDSIINLNAEIISNITGDELEDYDCSWFVEFDHSRNLLGNSTTDSNGVCNLEIFINNSFNVGLNKIILRIEEDGDRFYEVIENEKSKNLKIVESLNTTIINPLPGEYYREENIFFEGEVRDTYDVLPQQSLDNISWTLKGPENRTILTNLANSFTFPKNLSIGEYNLILNVSKSNYYSDSDNLNLTLKSHSRVDIVNFTPKTSTFSRENNVNITCSVSDQHTYEPIENYPVKISLFHEEDDLVYENIKNTHSNGKVTEIINISNITQYELGNYNISCGINNSLDLYNVSGGPKDNIKDVYSFELWEEINLDIENNISYIYKNTSDNFKEPYKIIYYFNASDSNGPVEDVNISLSIIENFNFSINYNETIDNCYTNPFGICNITYIPSRDHQRGINSFFISSEKEYYIGDQYRENITIYSPIELEWIDLSEDLVVDFKDYDPEATLKYGLVDSINGDLITDLVFNIDSEVYKFANIPKLKLYPTSMISFDDQEESTFSQIKWTESGEGSFDSSKIQTSSEINISFNEFNAKYYYDLIEFLIFNITSNAEYELYTGKEGDYEKLLTGDTEEDRSHNLTYTPDSIKVNLKSTNGGNASLVFESIDLSINSNDKMNLGSFVPFYSDISSDSYLWGDMENVENDLLVNPNGGGYDGIRGWHALDRTIYRSNKTMPYSGQDYSLTVGQEEMYETVNPGKNITIRFKELGSDSFDLSKYDSIGFFLREKTGDLTRYLSFTDSSDQKQMVHLTSHDPDMMPYSKLGGFKEHQIDLDRLTINPSEIKYLDFVFVNEKDTSLETIVKMDNVYVLEDDLFDGDPIETNWRPKRPDTYKFNIVYNDTEYFYSFNNSINKTINIIDPREASADLDSDLLSTMISEISKSSGQTTSFRTDKDEIRKTAILESFGLLDHITIYNQKNIGLELDVALEVEAINGEILSSSVKEDLNLFSLKPDEFINQNKKDTLFIEGFDQEEITIDYNLLKESIEDVSGLPVNSISQIETIVASLKLSNEGGEEVVIPIVLNTTELNIDIISPKKNSSLKNISPGEKINILFNYSSSISLENRLNIEIFLSSYELDNYISDRYISSKLSKEIFNCPITNINESENNLNVTCITPLMLMNPIENNLLLKVGINGLDISGLEGVGSKKKVENNSIIYRDFLKPSIDLKIDRINHTHRNISLDVEENSEFYKNDLFYFDSESFYDEDYSYLFSDFNNNDNTNFSINLDEIKDYTLNGRFKVDYSIDSIDDIISENESQNFSLIDVKKNLSRFGHSKNVSLIIDNKTIFSRSELGLITEFIEGNAKENLNHSENFKTILRIPINSEISEFGFEVSGEKMSANLNNPRSISFYKKDNETKVMFSDSNENTIYNFNFNESIEYSSKLRNKNLEGPEIIKIYDDRLFFIDRTSNLKSYSLSEDGSFSEYGSFNFEGYSLNKPNNVLVINDTVFTTHPFDNALVQLSGSTSKITGIENKYNFSLPSSLTAIGNKVIISSNKSLFIGEYNYSEGQIDEFYNFSLSDYNIEIDSIESIKGIETNGRDILFILNRGESLIYLFELGESINFLGELSEEQINFNSSLDNLKSPTDFSVISDENRYLMSIIDHGNNRILILETNDIEGNWEVVEIIDNFGGFYPEDVRIDIGDDYYVKDNIIKGLDWRKRDSLNHSYYLEDEDLISSLNRQLQKCKKGIYPAYEEFRDYSDDKIERDINVYVDDVGNEFCDIPIIFEFKNPGRLIVNDLILRYSESAYIRDISSNINHLISENESMVMEVDNGEKLNISDFKVVSINNSNHIKNLSRNNHKIGFDENGEYAVIAHSRDNSNNNNQESKPLFIKNIVNQESSLAKPNSKMTVDYNYRPHSVIPTTKTSDEIKGSSFEDEKINFNIENNSYDLEFNLHSNQKVISKIETEEGSEFEIENNINVSFEEAEFKILKKNHTNVSEIKNPISFNSLPLNNFSLPKKAVDPTEIINMSFGGIIISQNLSNFKNLKITFNYSNILDSLEIISDDFDSIIQKDFTIMKCDSDNLS